MSENSSSPFQALFVFLALFAGLFILWLSAGGPDNRPNSSPVITYYFGTREELRGGGKQIKRQEPPSGRELEGNITDVQKELKVLQEELRQARLRGVASPYEGMVSIRGGRPKERFAQTEYLTLSANRNNKTDVPITGWVLESVVTGQRATIGKAVNLPRSGVVNTEFPLLLPPGDTVNVNTGRSPVGVSFRVNKCVGYFEQFQNFSPRLRRECQNPTAEFDKFSKIPVTKVRIEDDKGEICREYIRKNINRCEINRAVLTDTELRLTEQCQAFIENAYTYTGCVANNQFEPDFFRNEWRVFLGSPAELWREKREIIRLLDQNGQTVDIFDY